MNQTDLARQILGYTEENKLGRNAEILFVDRAKGNEIVYATIVDSRFPDDAHVLVKVKYGDVAWVRLNFNRKSRLVREFLKRFTFWGIEIKQKDYQWFITKDDMETQFYTGVTLDRFGLPLPRQPYQPISIHDLRPLWRTAVYEFDRILERGKMEPLAGQCANCLSPSTRPPPCSPNMLYDELMTGLLRPGFYLHAIGAILKGADQRAMMNELSALYAGEWPTGMMDKQDIMHLAVKAIPGYIRMVYGFAIDY